MKKFLILVILVAAIAVPAAPYFIGTTVEEIFRVEHQEAAAESALSGFDIELVDYQRQLFKATATTRFSMVPDGKEKVSFDLLHHIDHIPQLTTQVIATVDSELVLGDEAAEQLALLFKGEAPLNINTRLFFDGHQEATITSPAASGELKGDESFTVEWKGVQGTAWQAAGRDKFSMKLNMPGVVLKSTHTAMQSSNDGDVSSTSDTDTDAKTELSVQQFGSMSIGDVHYDADMHKGESGMWHGKAKGSIAALDINTVGAIGEAFVVHIDSIGVRGEQDERDGLIHASGVIESNLINVNGFEATNAMYDVGLENLDAQALRAWQLAASELIKEDMDSADLFVPLLEQLPALVKAQPIIKINDISVDTPIGRFALNMDSRIIGEWDDMLLDNPAMLATMTKAELNASVPRTIIVSALQANARNAILAQNAVNEIEMNQEEIEKAVQQGISRQLNGLIRQGYVKENGPQLESRVDYNAGQLSINGVDASPLLVSLMGTMLQ